MDGINTRSDIDLHPLKRNDSQSLPDVHSIPVPQRKDSQGITDPFVMSGVDNHILVPDTDSNQEHSKTSMDVSYSQGKIDSPDEQQHYYKMIVFRNDSKDGNNFPDPGPRNRSKTCSIGCYCSCIRICNEN